MATELFRRLGEMEFANTGAPLAGGLVYFYRAGTTTLLNTFSDAAGAVPNANPLVLDGNGRFQTAVYLGDIITMGFNYKMVTQTSTAVVISTMDNIPAAAAAASSADFAPEFTPWTQVTFADSPLTLTAADAGKAYELDTTGGNIDIALPSPASTGNGKGFIFKKTATANIVNMGAVGLIDGLVAQHLYAQYEEIRISSNGAAYLVDRLYDPYPGGVGEVKAFAFAAVPSGWLECNGAAVPRTTYPDLFSKIGIIHGQGDGTTTFNLPDYRGWFLRGWAHGNISDPDRAARVASATGGVTGDNVGSAQDHAVGNHKHFMLAATNVTGAIPTAANQTSAVNGGGGIDSDYSLVGTAVAATLGLTSTQNNGSISTETRGANKYVLYCIKV